MKFELVGRSDAEHDPENAPGGPLFSVRPLRGDTLELGFGQRGPALERVRAGDAVRLTSDPELTRETERRTAQPISGRIPLRLAIAGRAGDSLRLTATADALGRSLSATAESKARLELARSGSGLDRALLSDKLGALGGSPFRLDLLEVSALAPGLHLPVSELKNLRRELVEQLERQLDQSERALPPEPCLPALRRELSLSATEYIGRRRSFRCVAPKSSSKP